MGSSCGMGMTHNHYHGAPLSRVIFWGVLFFIIFCGGVKIGEIKGRFLDSYGGGYGHRGYPGMMMQGGDYGSIRMMRPEGVNMPAVMWDGKEGEAVTITSSKR
jgi:hypothetical protein